MLVKIYSFLFYYQWLPFNLSVNGANVLADHADKDQLDGHEKEKTYHQGSNTKLKLAPKSQFVYKITDCNN